MKKLTSLWPILFLIAFNLYFFSPVLFQNKIFVTTGIINSDLLNQNYPNKNFYASKIKTGKLALWCDGYGNGFPLLAEGQTGEIYPLNLLFFFFLPMPFAFSFSLAFHYFLASLGTYLLSRKAYRMGVIPSLFGSLSFAYGSFLVIHLVHLNLVQVLSWLPLILLVVELGLQNVRPWRYVTATLIVILTLQFLAGHQSQFYFSLLFTGLYTLTRCLSLSKQGVRFKPKPLLALFVAGVSCLILSAIQLLPTLELLKMTKRSQGFSYETSTFYKMANADLVSFFKPHLESFKEVVVANETSGTYSAWESYLYQGFLTPFFLILGIYSLLRNRLAQRPLGIIMVLFFLASLGRNSFVYEVIWRVIPFMKQMRYSTRFLFGFQLAASLIAGFGLDYYLRAHSEQIATSEASYLLNLSALRKSRNLKRAAGLTLLLVLSLDLLLNQRPINYVDEAGKWLEPPESAQYLRQNLGHSRFFSINANAFDPTLSIYPPAQYPLRNILPTNYHLLFGIPNVYVIIEAFNPEKDDILALRSSTAAAWNPDKKEVVPLTAFLRIMEAKGAKYALTDLPIVNPNSASPPLELITTYPLNPPLKRIILLSQIADLNKAYDWGMIDTNKIYLYRFQNFLPAAKIFHQAALTKDDQEALNLLADGTFPLGQRVITTSTNPSLNLGLTSEKESVAVIKNTDEEKIYQVKTLTPGILSTTDYSYPGWKAFVDGQEKPVITTNYNFRGVYLENSGEMEVRFLFQSSSFRLGAIISLVAGVIFLLLLGRKPRSSGRG
ncbi:MAG: YfhO family protein [bacterium]|nr:YfhO family protein [bacterium]